MNKRILKGLYIFIGIFLSLFLLNGCKEKKTEPSDLKPDTVTCKKINLMPGSYDVYVFSSNEIIHYDFTSYWYDHAYDYFTDPLPEESEYTKEIYSIEDYEWEEIVNILNEKNFDTFPEDFSAEEEILDGGAYYIEVLSGQNRYFSGGYCVDYGKDPKRKSYVEIENVLNKVISAAHQRYKENYVYVPEPISRSYFETLDINKGYYSICEEIGDSHKTEFLSGNLWKVWNLDDGSQAWVMFDEYDIYDDDIKEKKIKSLRIVDDEGFLILYNSVDEKYVDTEAKYIFLDKKEYSKEETNFFDFLSLIAYSEMSITDTEKLNRIKDYLIVTYDGEKYDVSESDFKKGVSKRMKESDVSSFYKNILNEEYTSRSYGDTSEDYGIISNNGYFCSASNVDFPYKCRIEEVSKKGDDIFVEAQIEDKRLGVSSIASVVLYLTPSDSKYGYDIVDIKCYDLNHNFDNTDKYMYELTSLDYFEKIDNSYDLERINKELDYYVDRYNISAVDWYVWNIDENKFLVSFDSDGKVKQVRKRIGKMYTILYDSTDENLANPDVFYNMNAN